MVGLFIWLDCLYENVLILVIYFLLYIDLSLGFVETIFDC